MSTGTHNCISAVLLALAVVAGIRSLYLFHYSTLSRLKYLMGSSESKFMLIRYAFKGGYSAVETTLGGVMRHCGKNKPEPMSLKNDWMQPARLAFTLTALLV